MKSSLDNQRGFAVVYAMIILAIATAGGSMLIFMARNDRVSVSDYAKVRTASQAAFSALRACEGQFHNQPQTALEILKGYRDSHSRAWMLGTAADADKEQKIKLWNENDAPQYSARILGYDDDSSYIIIEGIGYGSYGGKKRVIASYRLDGIELLEPVGYKNAIYIAADGYDFNQSIHIFGDIYFGGGFRVQSSSGTVIEGNLKTGSSSFVSELNVGITVNGNLYLQTPLKIQNATPVVNGMAGFEKNVELLHDLTVGGDSYSNSTASGNASRDINMSGKTFTHSGSFNTSFITNGTAVSSGGTIPIASKLSMYPGNEGPDTVKLNAISPTSKIKNFSSLGFSDLTGTNLQNAYDNTPSSSLWNGFLVVRISPSAGGPNFNTQSGTFNGKVIWIIEKSLSINQKWYESGPDALSLIYVGNNGGLVQFGWNGLFKGYIHLTGNGSATYAFKAGSTFRGAIHHVSPSASFQVNSSGTINFYYDEEILNSLATTGVVARAKYPSTNPPPQWTITLKDVKIRPVLLSIQS